VQFRFAESRFFDFQFLPTRCILVNVISMLGTEFRLSAYLCAHTCLLRMTALPCEGRNSSVGIAICYGMVCPVIDSRGCRDFSYSSKTAVYNGYRVSLVEIRRPGCGEEHPTPSSDEVKERISLYRYYPLVFNERLWV
jgi:hypothetical protein